MELYQLYPHLYQAALITLQGQHINVNKGEDLMNKTFTIGGVEHSQAREAEAWAAGVTDFQLQVAVLGDDITEANGPIIYTWKGVQVQIPLVVSEVLNAMFECTEV